MPYSSEPALVAERDARVTRKARSGLIVHEWIESLGGAEKVLQEMVKAFPDSRIACLWDDTQGAATGKPVLESPLSRTPLRRSKAAAVPFMPEMWARYRPPSDVEWLLVSSHAFAHHVAARTGSLPTYVYTHTPARYVWEPSLDTRGGAWWASAVSSPLRAVDRRRARRENVRYAANSQFVRERIERTWSVPAEVIYPPVDVGESDGILRSGLGAGATDVEHALAEGLPEDFLLGASRWVPYKGLDKVIAMGSALGLPVVIAGRGPDEARLRALAGEAGVPVIFVHAPSDTLLRWLYARALAFIFPPVEDFGIMPVEAMAAGARVIVNAVGGASESVLDGIAGVTVSDFGDPRELESALSRVQRLDRRDARARSLEFSSDAFRRRLGEWVHT